jgi:hypothetical protein
VAREFVRLLTSIHEDPDWLGMTSQQHDVYVALMTSQDLSWCGVMPYIPKRLARFSADLTERRVIGALSELENLRMVIVDRSTEELLVRTYIRHDGLLKKPNIARAMEKALVRVHSGDIRAAIIQELGRVYLDDPGMPCWDALSAELMIDVSAASERMGSNYSPNYSPIYSEN